MKLYKPSWINHEGHPIFSIDIHPDDSRFATGGQGDDSTGRVVIWNLKAVLADSTDISVPKVFCQLDHHSACVNCVRWSNSGRYLASGGDDKVVIIWKLVSKFSGNSIGGSTAFGKSNLEHWKTVSILRSHEGDILDLSWSPGDTYLASCSVDNTVIIWDAQNFPQIIRTLKGHSSMVKGVTWDPVGKYIATQSEDKTLRIWRTSDWSVEHIVKEPFTECGGTTHVLRLGWSPDGLYLVSAHAMNCGGPTAQIIERDGWKTDKDFVGHRKAVVCVRFNKNIQEKNRVKQCCVALGSRDRSISVWSTALKRPVVVVKEAFSHSVMDLAWSHCGTIMMACSWDGSVMAAQFSWKEIGRPLSQEETISLYQRFYGNSVVANSTPNVIPNMEVFLARQSTSIKKAVAASTSLEIEDIKITEEKKSAEPPIDLHPVTKGPEKQIETRTADGKRRITPKFLPLPDADPSIISTLREEAIVFQQHLSENPPNQNQDNLRERMVSSIDDVSFGENKGILIDNVNKSAGNLSSNPSDPSTLETKSLHAQSEKTLDNDGGAGGIEDNAGAIMSVVNGVQSGEESSSDKNSSVMQKKRVALLSVPPPKEVNGHHPIVNVKETESEITSVKPLTNGFSNDNNKSSAESDNQIIEGAASQSINLDEKEPKNSTVSNNNSETVIPVTTSIPVKRKRRLTDDMKPPQGVKKRLLPNSLGTSPLNNKSNKLDGGGDILATVVDEVRCPNKFPVPANKPGLFSPSIKSGSTPKSRLTQMKIESVLTLQVSTKPDSAYCLEVTNRHKRVDGTCHQLKCKHQPSSLQGLEWIICTDTPICGISGDVHRIVALCEDATVHILDLKGRYALSPFVISSYPSKMLQSGPYLLIITTKAYLHVWNIHTKKVVLKSESLLPLLSQPGNESGNKAVDVAHAYLAPGEVPAIVLSNGKSFMYDKEMCSWTLFSDPSGLVSSPLMPDASDLASLMSLHQLGGRRRKPEPAVISHIKLQLIKATEMRKADSIKQWILVLGKTLGTHGLEKELHILCEDLLGPTHSSTKPGSSWNPKIAGCVDKRNLLREILNNLLEDLRWQDLFCEFDELLKEADDSTASQLLPKT